MLTDITMILLYVNLAGCQDYSLKIKSRVYHAVGVGLQFNIFVMTSGYWIKPVYDYQKTLLQNIFCRKALTSPCWLHKFYLPVMSRQSNHSDLGNMICNYE